MIRQDRVEKIEAELLYHAYVHFAGGAAIAYFFHSQKMAAAHALVKAFGCR
jgi:hypothetical protein